MMITYAQAPTPLTTRAPTIISPPPTSTLDVIGWLRTIAARTTALAGSETRVHYTICILSYLLDIRITNLVF